MLNRIAGLAGLVSLGWALQIQAEPVTIAADQICASSDEHFVGPCFKIHARLQAGADNIVVWIWPVGTHRYLGYLGYADLGRGDEPCDLPPVLISPLQAYKTVYADVIVRPISRTRRHQMQLVCIAGANHLVVVDQKP